MRFCLPFHSIRSFYAKHLRMPTLCFNKGQDRLSVQLTFSLNLSFSFVFFCVDILLFSFACFYFSSHLHWFSNIIPKSHLLAYCFTTKSNHIVICSEMNKDTLYIRCFAVRLFIFLGKWTNIVLTESSLSGLAVWH